MQSRTIVEKILSNLILESEALKFRKSDTDFTRNRKLPLVSLITSVLQLSNKGSGDSVALNLTDFLESIGSNITINGAAVTRSRSKLSYQYFNFLFKKLISTIYENEEEESRYKWHGFNLIGIDGSKVKLPTTREIRKRFDPKSGLSKSTGHYPQCLVSTAYDLIREYPIARTIIKAKGSERNEACRMIRSLPTNSLILFDRGYLSFELLEAFKRRFKGELLLRCPGSQTFNEIKEFIDGDKN